MKAKIYNFVKIILITKLSLSLNGFSASPCVPLSIFQSNVTGVTGVYSDIIHVACTEGYELAYDVYQQAVTCTESGAWDPPSNCTG